MEPVEHFPREKFLFQANRGQREEGNDVVEMHKKLRLIESLIKEYKALSEAEKSKVQSVHDYLASFEHRLVPRKTCFYDFRLPSARGNNWIRCWSTPRRSKKQKRKRNRRSRPEHPEETPGELFGIEQEQRTRRSATVSRGQRDFLRR